PSGSDASHWCARVRGHACGSGGAHVATPPFSLGRVLINAQIAVGYALTVRLRLPRNRNHYGTFPRVVTLTRKIQERLFERELVQKMLLTRWGQQKMLRCSGSYVVNQTREAIMKSKLTGVLAVAGCALALSVGAPTGGNAASFTAAQNSDECSTPCGIIAGNT